MTAPMTVPLQSSQALHQALEVPADAEVQDRELPTVCFETREQRGGGREILNEEETKYSLFDVESSPGSYPRPPPFTTGSHGMASAVVSHERIVAPNGRSIVVAQGHARPLFF